MWHKMGDGTGSPGDFAMRVKTHNLPSHEFMLAAVILLALAGVVVTFVY